MSEKKNIDATSRIITVKLIDFSVMKIDKTVEINPANFAFKYEVNVKQDPAINGFKIKCTTMIFSNMDQNIHLGTIETYGEFEVLNLKDILAHFEGNTPTQLLAMFTGVVISSTRGMLIIKSKNTIIEGAMIPMMDPNIFFTPDAMQNTQGKITK